MPYCLPSAFAFFVVQILGHVQKLGCILPRAPLALFVEISVKMWKLF